MGRQVDVIVILSGTGTPVPDDSFFFHIQQPYYELLTPGELHEIHHELP